MLATAGIVPVFTAVNSIRPVVVPFSAIPTDGLSLSQRKLTASVVVSDVNVTAVSVPVQTTILSTFSISGIGFTVRVSL